MAELSSPISGGIRVARSRVSSSVFTGKFVPQKQETTQPDPITTGLIRANSLQLERVSQSLNGINSQMTAIDTTLRAVLQNLEVNQALEKQKVLQEQNQQRLLAQQKILEGKESLIERKIQSALSKPIVAIAPKVQFTLQSVMTYLTTLFAGWLLNQGFQTIKAYSEGNKEKLEEIKNNVLATLGIVGGIFLAINVGVNALIITLSRVGVKLLGAVGTGLFLKLPQLIFNGIRKGFGAVNTGGGKAPTTTTTTTRTDGKTSSTAGSLSQTPPKPTLAGRLKRLLPGFKTNIAFGTGAELLSGESPDRAIAGGLTGGAFSTIAGAAGKALFGKYGSLLSLPAYFYGSDLGKSGLESMKSMFSGEEKVENKAEIKPAEAEDTQSKLEENKTETEEKKVENKAEIKPAEAKDTQSKLEENKTETEEKKVEEEKKVSSNTQAMTPLIDTKPFFGADGVFATSNFGDIAFNVSDSDLTPKEPEETKTTQAQIAPVKTSADRSMVSQSLSNLQEPAPNIITAPIREMQKKELAQAPPSRSVSSDSAVFVPTFDTSDKGNIYLPSTIAMYGVIDMVG